MCIIAVSSVIGRNIAAISSDCAEMGNNFPGSFINKFE